MQFGSSVVLKVLPAMFPFQETQGHSLIATAEHTLQSWERKSGFKIFKVMSGSLYALADESLILAQLCTGIQSLFVNAEL